LHKETLYDLHSSINIINQEHTDNPVLKDSEYLMIKKTLKLHIDKPKYKDKQLKLQNTRKQAPHTL